MSRVEEFGEGLLHGSPQTIPLGATVRPGMGVYGYGAYATNDSLQAHNYADTFMTRPGWKGQGTLFGTVYNVEPVEGSETERIDPDSSFFLNKSGYKVTGIKEHVIPRDQEELARKHGVV